MTNLAPSLIIKFLILLYWKAAAPTVPQFVIDGGKVIVSMLQFAVLNVFAKLVTFVKYINSLNETAVQLLNAVPMALT